MAESSEGRLGGGSRAGGGTVGDRDDMLISTANTIRIMRKGLAKDVKIDNEAKDLVRKAVSEFICRLTSDAAEKCEDDCRIITSGEDILYSMKNFRLDNYHEVCEIYLKKLREEKKHRQIVLALPAQTGSAAAMGGSQEMTGNEDTEEDDVMPAAAERQAQTAGGDLNNDDADLIKWLLSP